MSTSLKLKGKLKLTNVNGVQIPCVHAIIKIPSQKHHGDARQSFASQAMMLGFQFKYPTPWQRQRVTLPPGWISMMDKETVYFLDTYGKMRGIIHQKDPHEFAFLTRFQMSVEGGDRWVRLSIHDNFHDTAWERTITTRDIPTRAASKLTEIGTHFLMNVLVEVLPDYNHIGAYWNMPEVTLDSLNDETYTPWFTSILADSTSAVAHLPQT